MTKIKTYLGRKISSTRKSDKLSIGDRSSLMAKIKSKNTGLELTFFEELKKRGLKFRSHPIGVYGKPDLIYKNIVCVFIDSDFWHGWQYPRWKHKLKNDFWRNKIENNRRRDRIVTYKLKRKGYIVLRLWEHKIKENSNLCIQRILDKVH